MPTPGLRAIEPVVEAEIAALGVIESRPQIIGSKVVWAADEVLSSTQRRGRILEYDLTSGRTQVLYSAEGTGAVQNVRVSGDWVVWYEFRARSSAVDTRLYAMARGGGAPLLIDDARSHAQFVLPADMTLFGDHVYWTVPEVVNGVWKGRLMRRALTQGRDEVVATAPDGAVIAWPSVSSLGVAYEVLFEKGPPFTKLVVATLPPPPPPVSEPAIGSDFLVFKIGERFQPGRIGMVTADRVMYDLGPGEHPEASEHIAAWAADEPSDNEIRVAFSDRPSCLVTITQNRGRSDVHEFLASTGGDRVLWIVRDGRRAVGEQDAIRVATLRSTVCEQAR